MKKKRKGLIAGVEAITVSRHMLITKTNHDLGTGYIETIIETSKRRITLLFFTIFPDPSSSEKSGTPMRF